MAMLGSSWRHSAMSEENPDGAMSSDSTMRGWREIPQPVAGTSLIEHHEYTWRVFEKKRARLPSQAVRAFDQKTPLVFMPSL